MPQLIKNFQLIMLINTNNFLFLEKKVDHKYNNIIHLVSQEYGFDKYAHKLWKELFFKKEHPERQPQLN